MKEKANNNAPTIKDVAREAGVATGTVSKVINGLAVGEEYRRRVLDAIEKLGYRVNIYAKGLKGNRTYTIAVLLPNLVNPYFCALASALNRTIAERGFQMMVFCTDYDERTEQESVFTAERKKVDGIICLSYNPNISIPEGVSFVSIDRYFGTGIPCIAADNYGGGMLAARTLYENGCRRLAFMRVGSRLTNEPNKRKDGFKDWCERENVEYTAKIIDDGAPFSEFDEFLSAHCHDGKLDFDGIFCVTDSLAWYVMKRIRAMGLRIPEDVQIIGFDGIRMFGSEEYYCSTIVQPVAAIAQKAVDVVLSEKDGELSALICLPVKYEAGGTTRA